MIDIKLKKFMCWLETQLDNKYWLRIESLKRLIIGFFNLSTQLIQIYLIIKSKIQKQSKDQTKSIQMIDKSIYILQKITQKYPICLDSIFLDKFLRTFQENINVICTFYHSLSHLITTNQVNTKYQQEKLVQGIQKLYTIHSKIKQVRISHIDILKHISHYKKTFNNKINSILTNIQKIKQKQSIIDGFQNYAIQFSKGFQQSIKKINSQQQIKKDFMKMYFNIMHQLYSTQAKLQTLLDNALNLSEQIKLKKIKVSFDVQQGSIQFLKWINVLLKPNFSMKNIKKIKIQQISKYLINLFKEKQFINHYQYTPNISEIEETLQIILTIICQLEKIQQSGLLNMISEYKDSIMPIGIKKILHKLIDYQNHMAKYYQIHQETKKLQKSIQVVILQQLGYFVNIIVDFEY